ncbi:MAG: hypothetical protein RLZ44_628 [Pseudomonadota bacterium]
MAELRLAALQPQHLHPVDLRVAAGECLALHGPSGSGKTLLLRAIADLDPNRGEAWLDDVARSSLRAHQWRRRLGLVPAESHWWDETVGTHAAAWDHGLLERLGFPAAVLEWEVSRLSSGERQRLALARALANRPDALLLDEPTANLDADNTARLEELLAEYRRAHHTAVIWVSHDPAQRLRVAERSAVLQDGRLRTEAAA